MASGTFIPGIEKPRPGQYFNIHGTGSPTINTAARGAALVMLTNYDWGPTGIVTINGAAVDANKAMLGRSVTADNPGMLMVREALKGAATVYAYINNQGEKAKGEVGDLSVTAKYGGTLGNSLKVVVETNVVGGFDVTVYLGADAVTFIEGVATVGDVIAAGSNYVDFAVKAEGSAETALTEEAGASLSGGTDVKTTNAEASAYLDAAETVDSNGISFPFTESQLHSLAKSKAQYLRESMGRSTVIVCPNYDGNYEGIINVTNGVTLKDGSEITPVIATAYVAGISAGATDLESNTYKVYEGADSVLEPKSNEEAVAAIKNGEFFFSVSERGEVIVEYDINSLTTYTSTKPKSYRKNKVIRVIDSVRDMIKNSFAPNQYTNDERGWSEMESAGRAILKYFGERGSIKNVDLDADFKVDTSLSVDDSTYFNVAIQPVDAAEKLYFDIATS